MKRGKLGSDNAPLLALLFLLLFAHRLGAGVSTWEYAVRTEAAVRASPPQITLIWVQDMIGPPISYSVSRKTLTDASWVLLTNLPGSATTYVDSSVSVGKAYEYQIHKICPGYEGYGYLYSGINVPLVENRGKVILVVDNTYATDLAAELAMLQQDMVGDGWTVVRQYVSRTNSVTEVKALIRAQYDADPTNVNTVFLFGHVPVPYSGNIAPDEMIPGHQGAWPADVYYGDMNGTWTDNSVNTTAAADSRNWNVPGDGKFDQSAIPSRVELMVGRVDLANITGKKPSGQPASASEVELLRRYLLKDHGFRGGGDFLHTPFLRRSVIYDGFGDAGGRAYAASSWRNFAPLLGLGNNFYMTNAGAWLDNLNTNGFEFAYGCGPGVYNGISGLGTTIDLLVAGSPKAVFFMLFGNWLGDWDSEDNFQRATLATYSGLACCWSGSPHWYLQHMALGQTLGFSTRLTQNNGPNGLYRTQTNAYAGLVHIALMGDPTLRLHTVLPPNPLIGYTNGNAMQLNWQASPECSGYYVYRAASPNGSFTRITSALLTNTAFSDTSPGSGTNIYMVRAVKLEKTPSGTYTNASQGAFFALNIPSATRTSVPISSIRALPSGIVINWNSRFSAHYRVASATTLPTTNWTDLTADIIATTSTSWTDTTASAISERFYRVFELH